MKIKNINLNPFNIGRKIFKNLANRADQTLLNEYQKMLSVNFIITGMSAINAITEQVGITIRPTDVNASVIVIEGVKADKEGKFIEIFSKKVPDRSTIIIFVKPTAAVNYKILNSSKQIMRVISYDMTSEDYNLVKIIPSKDACFLQGETNETK